MLASHVYWRIWDCQKWQRANLANVLPIDGSMDKASPSHTPSQAATKPISTLPPQRHVTHPASLRQHQQWSRNAHQSSTQHAPPPPPSLPPKHHTSSPRVSQPTSSSFTESSMNSVVVTDHGFQQQSKDPLIDSEKGKWCSQQFLYICNNSQWDVVPHFWIRIPYQHRKWMT